MNLIQFLLSEDCGRPHGEEEEQRDSGFFVHMEEETVNNTDYRRVLFTGEHSQLVLMNLAPGVEIGEETHPVDQFIRVEGGTGMSIINGQEREITDGDAIIVPGNAVHNIINNSGTEELKLYTVYSPPQHEDGTVQPTKEDEKEEHTEENEY